MADRAEYEPSTRIEQLLMEGPTVAESKQAAAWVNALLGTSGRSYACTPEFLFFMHNRIPFLIHHLRSICESVRERLAARVQQYPRLANRLTLLERFADTQQSIVDVQLALGAYGKNDLINPTPATAAFGTRNINWRERRLVAAWGTWIQEMLREAKQLDGVWETMSARNHHHHPPPFEQQQVVDESRKRRAIDPDPEQEPDAATV